MKVMRHLLIENVLYMPKIMLFEVKILDCSDFYGRAHAKNASLFFILIGNLILFGFVLILF